MQNKIINILIENVGVRHEVNFLFLYRNQPEKTDKYYRFKKIRFINKSG